MCCAPSHNINCIFFDLKIFYKPDFFGNKKILSLLVMMVGNTKIFKTFRILPIWDQRLFKFKLLVVKWYMGKQNIRLSSGTVSHQSGCLYFLRTIYYCW